MSARARQVRDDLTALGTTNELAVYGVALDDRALFVDEWRNRALRALSDPSTESSPLRAEFRRLLQGSWHGEASIDSVGYRLARAYESAVEAALRPCAPPCKSQFGFCYPVCCSPGFLCIHTGL